MERMSNCQFYASKPKVAKFDNDSSKHGAQIKNLKKGKKKLNGAKRMWKWVRNVNNFASDRFPIEHIIFRMAQQILPNVQICQ